MQLRANIRRTLRRWRSRFRPSVAILGYHRVSAGTPDPLGLSVAPARFEAHLAAIARIGTPTRLQDAVAALRAGSFPPRAVVITFDDGYSDNLHTVLPLLECFGIPATIFLTSGNRGGEFWWDRLARVHARAGGNRTTEVLATQFQSLTEAEREARLQQLEDGIPRDARTPFHRALTEAEVRQLAASPLIEIGAHTVSHEALPALPAERQRNETRQGRRDLESLVGRRVTSFAYPHGALTARTIEIVAEAGYTAACCSKVDVAAAGAPPLALPRLWPADHDGPEFERWLRGWLHAA